MKRLTLVFMLLIAHPLFAHEEANEFLSMSLDELLQVEIISSTLTPEKLKTVPSAVTVFTHEEIDRLGLDKLGELMNLVPGFQAYQSSGSSLETPFSSRGRRIGSTTAEILILVDGQRYDSPRSSGSSSLAPIYPLEFVEKVEFIRGPGAAIYGSNAMMGMINITTRSNLNQLTLGYGSLNRKKMYLQTSSVFDSLTMDIAVHIESDEGDNYDVQDTFSAARIDTDDPLKIADLNFKLQWENTRIIIKHNQFKVENFYELDTLSNGFNERDGDITSISLKHNFNWQQVKSYLWLSYNNANAVVNTQLTPPNVFSGPPSAPYTSNPLSNDALFVSGDFGNYSEGRGQWHNDWKINSKSSLQFGVELRRIDAPEAIASNNFDLGEFADGISPITYYGALLPTTPIQAESERNIIGFYTQYQKQFFESTYLTLGLRYDDFSDIGSELSPRLALVQEINPHNSVKLLYGQAFRAPSESELNLLNNPVLLGNPNLKPETVKSLDLIWIGQWVHTGFSLGYFESRFDDSIVQMDNGGGTHQYTNVQQDPIKGVEFELSHELNRSWLVRASITRIIEKPDPSFREADNKGSFTINYQNARWNANLVSSYFGEREMTAGANRITLEDYWVIFAKLQYHVTDQLETFIQAKNLLDEDYLTPASGSNLTKGIPNRGREFLLGLNWKF